MHTGEIANANILRRPSRLFSWIMRHSYRREVRGLTIAVANQDPTTVEAVFGRMTEAVECLEAHDARAFRELLVFTRGIFVFGTRGGGPAEWNRDDGVVVVQYEYAAEAARSAQELGVVLAHEATHVWLERHGFEYIEGWRRRLEEICRRRELRLTRRLPDAERLVALLGQDPGWDRECFTDEAFHDRAVAELKRLGVPSWLVEQTKVWSRWMRQLTRAWSRPA